MDNHGVEGEVEEGPLGDFAEVGIGGEEEGEDIGGDVEAVEVVGAVGATTPILFSGSELFS